MRKLLIQQKKMSKRIEHWRFSSHRLEQAASYRNLCKFLVGSGNPSLSNFETAIADARRLFDEAESLGFKPKLLDLGGGFPGYEFEGESTFEDVSGRTMNGVCIVKIIVCI